MKKIIFSVTIIVIAGFTAYFGFDSKDKLGQQTPKPQTSEPPVAEESFLPPTEPDKVFAEPVVFGSLKKSYSGQNFSFKYSDGFKIFSNPASQLALSGVEGEVVTVENAKGTGFQIFIMALDEPGPITSERIWQDMPDAEIMDPKDADLDGAETLVFYGYDENMGETFEAWVVRKSRLYQISGPKTAEKLIIETLETWSWK